LIRAEQARDASAVRDVVVRAFVTHPDEVGDLVEAVRASEHYVPHLALVAEVDGRVAGFVMASHATLVDGERRHRVLTLSPLAVAPEHERRGIGSALVRALVARAAETGEPLLTLEGSPAYYGRLGFEPAVRHGVTIRLPDWAPPEAAQVRLLSGYDPTIRGTLEYPPAFDSVAAH
jgi:putative acetyltransferase